MEIIKNIREITSDDNLKIEFVEKYRSGALERLNFKVEGYEIETNKRTLRILIDSSSQCCEEWGYVDTSDDLSEFIGARVIKASTICSNDGIERIKTVLPNFGENCRYNEEYTNVSEELKEAIRGYSEEVKRCIPFDSVEFIEIETSNGVLVFAVYNNHNGYYGHHVLIQIDSEERKTI